LELDFDPARGSATVIFHETRTGRQYAPISVQVSMTRWEKTHVAKRKWLSTEFYENFPWSLYAPWRCASNFCVDERFAAERKI
jgi:hypothetical protein